MAEGFAFFLLVFGVPILVLGFLGSWGITPGERSDEEY